MRFAPALLCMLIVSFLRVLVFVVSLGSGFWLVLELLARLAAFALKEQVGGRSVDVPRAPTLRLFPSLRFAPFGSGFGGSPRCVGGLEITSRRVEVI
jgi:hypothetical protein